LRDGHFTQVDYPGAVATVGRGINNAGDITGNYVDAAGIESGFILQNGTFHRVRVAHSCSTDVWMAEDNGRVLIGDFGVGDDCANSVLHGYLRNRPGDFQTIDFPSGGSFPCTAPRWINERGDIVGLYVVANDADECYGGALRGFLLRQGKYIAIDVPGSTSTTVLGINDDGMIVGTYSDKLGVDHGFKAVPK